MWLLFIAEWVLWYLECFVFLTFKFLFDCGVNRFQHNLVVGRLWYLVCVFLAGM
jgi:hypothetical protein